MKSTLEKLEDVFALFLPIAQLHAIRYAVKFTKNIIDIRMRGSGQTDGELRMDS